MRREICAQLKMCGGAFSGENHVLWLHFNSSIQHAREWTPMNTNTTILTKGSLWLGDPTAVYLLHWI